MENSRKIDWAEGHQALFLWPRMDGTTNWHWKISHVKPPHTQYHTHLHCQRNLGCHWPPFFNLVYIYFSLSWVSTLWIHQMSLLSFYFCWYYYWSKGRNRRLQSVQWYLWLLVYCSGENLINKTERMIIPIWQHHFRLLSGPGTTAGDHVGIPGVVLFFLSILLLLFFHLFYFGGGNLCPSLSIYPQPLDPAVYKQ